jgi:hypothetical protein
MINPELFNFTVVTENNFKRQNGEAVMAGFKCHRLYMVQCSKPCSLFGGLLVIIILPQASPGAIDISPLQGSI